LTVVFQGDMQNMVSCSESDCLSYGENGSLHCATCPSGNHDSEAD
jgi:hypothetical protein